MLGSVSKLKRGKLMRWNQAFASVEAISAAVREAYESTSAAVLKQKFGQDMFRSYLEGLKLLGVSQGVVVFTAPSGVAGEWAERHAGETLAGLLQAAGLEAVHVQVVRESDVPEGQRALFQPGIAVAPAGLGGGAPPSATAAADESQPSFENFCVGASNRNAYAMAKAIASGQEAKLFPLVLFHGPPGVGKTHLLTAIYHEVQRLNPARRVRYMMAPLFIQEFQDGLAKKKDLSAFKASVRENDIFILDDGHRIAGKRYTEEELLDTIAVILNLGGQVVISADHGPQGLDGFDERLQRQLRAATDCHIEEPDFELRQRIAEVRVAFYRKSDPEFAVPSVVRDMIAGRILPNGREVDSAVRQLLMSWRADRQEITVASAEEALRHKFAPPERRITMELVIKGTAKAFQMSGDEMLKRTRQQAIARPRQVAMYLCTKMTPRSLPEIARKFGGYDHTTVLYARKRVAELLAADPAFSAEVQAAEAAVRELAQKGNGPKPDGLPLPNDRR